MIPINSTYAPLQAFVEELMRCGMRHAVTSPGSRNAPLALSLAGAEGLDAVSVLDERSAGFVALGMAKASGLPVAVTCTSGTAAANLHPAVVEAYEARVPLIVLTADRPPELRDVGAGQAIDQIGIYGSAVSWFVEVGNIDPGPESNVHHRSLACRAWWTALGDRPGPVHLNFPLREPLAPRPEELEPGDWQGRVNGRPWVDLRRAEDALAPGQVEELADRLAGTPRGAIVCGPLATHAGTGGASGTPQPGGRADVGGAAPSAASLPGAVARLAAALDWPILAEPASGLRCGPHDRSRVVAHYDVLLRSELFATEQAPDLILRIGDTPTSKPLRALLADVEQIVLDPQRAWHEPTRSADLLLQMNPSVAVGALAEAVERRGVGPEGGAGDRAPNAARAGGRLRAWLEADALVSPALAAEDDLSEPKLIAAIEPALADGTQVWVSSSMPIRHVETFFPQSPKALRFLANRGANGIDGVVSSAAGAALATGAPTVLVIGELALQHDLGGLLTARRAGARLAILCVNNGGGAIFDLLPVAGAAAPEDYEHHIATPTELSLATVADLAGMRHAVASTPEGLRAALAEGTLVEVVTERPLTPSGAIERVVGHLDTASG
jgi:2-succinyl-5-enolpyruvyl-6-hydroxy-3-cyclohexene-1-carboxylate synthase